MPYPHFSAGFDTTLSHPEEISSRLSDWESKGLIARELEGLSPEHYPLSPALTCLVNEKFITKESAVVKDVSNCNSASVVSETTSDMWGAKIAGLALKEKPPSTNLEKLSSLSSGSIKLMCAKREGPKPLTELDSPKWDKQRPSSARYINDRDRDEATLLADRNIQNALGCAPQANRQACMDHFDKAFVSSSAQLNPGNNQHNGLRRRPVRRTTAPAKTVD